MDMEGMEQDTPKGKVKLRRRTSDGTVGSARSSPLMPFTCRKVLPQEQQGTRDLPRGVTDLPNEEA